MMNKILKLTLKHSMLFVLADFAALFAEPCGYEGSIPVKLLPAVDIQRMESVPVQDLGTTGWTQLNDANGMGYWGLDALTARQDIATRPDEVKNANLLYQDERVIYADPATGAMMMKVSNSPYGLGGDVVSYFGKTNWNADGSYMTWIRCAFSSRLSLWGAGYYTALPGNESWDQAGEYAIPVGNSSRGIALRRGIRVKTP